CSRADLQRRRLVTCPACAGHVRFRRSRWRSLQIIAAASDANVAIKQALASRERCQRIRRRDRRRPTEAQECGGGGPHRARQPLVDLPAPPPPPPPLSPAPPHPH